MADVSNFREVAKKKKEPIMNFQVLLQREALQGNFCATREIIF